MDQEDHTEMSHHGTLEAQREYTAKNRLYYRAYARAYSKRNRVLMNGHKQLAALQKRNFINGLKGRPCADCGREYPSYVMQFDHRDPATKAFNIGSAESKTLEALQHEADKCDVVCANCHAARTYYRNPRKRK